MKTQRVIRPSQLLADWKRLLHSANDFILHAAPASVGYLVGGVDTFIDTLIQALGTQKNLLVPSFTSGLTDPSTWVNPPASPDQIDDIRLEMPCFHPDETTPQHMGSHVVKLWKYPGALRSHHPVESVIAFGKNAHEIVFPHPLDDPMGTNSPWARLVARHAEVLLVGIGFERCSLIHHAQTLYESIDSPTYSMKIQLNHVDDSQEDSENYHWVDVYSGTNCSEGFSSVEHALRHEGLVDEFLLGEARVMKVKAKSIMQICHKMLNENPLSLLCSDDTCLACKQTRMNSSP